MKDLSHLELAMRQKVKPQTQSPFVVGVGGGTASGKSYFCEAVRRALPPEEVSILPVDLYYFDRPGLSLEERSRLNFDHPDALDFPLAVQHLGELKKGKAVNAPVYDFSQHMRTDASIQVGAAPLILVEGILVFHAPALRELFDYGVFFDVSPELRYERRLDRDIRERSRTPESVKWQWETTVEPMYQQYCKPSSRYANKVVSRQDLEVDIIVNEFLEIYRTRSTSAKAEGIPSSNFAIKNY